MAKQNIRIEQGNVLNVTTDANSTAQIWGINGKDQDILLNSVSASTTVQLGPYLDIQQFRVESLTGNFPTIATVGKNVITPKALRDVLTIPVAAAVADATGSGDVVAQFNALTASLRTAGLLSTT